MGGVSQSQNMGDGDMTFVTLDNEAVDDYDPALAHSHSHAHTAHHPTAQPHSRSSVPVQETLPAVPSGSAIDYKAAAAANKQNDAASKGSVLPSNGSAEQQSMANDIASSKRTGAGAGAGAPASMSREMPTAICGAGIIHEWRQQCRSRQRRCESPGGWRRGRWCGRRSGRSRGRWIW